MTCISFIVEMDGDDVLVVTDQRLNGTVQDGAALVKVLHENIDLTDVRIVYGDGFHRWVGIVVEDGRFARYVPIDTRIVTRRDAADFARTAMEW